MAITPEPTGPPAGDNLYLDLAAAAELLGVTLAELRRRIRLEELESIKVGTQTLVRRAGWRAGVRLTGADCGTHC